MQVLAMAKTVNVFIPPALYMSLSIIMKGSQQGRGLPMSLRLISLGTTAKVYSLFGNRTILSNHGI